MTMIKYVYPEVGRCGLCNMLYPWARAVCFAREQGCRVLAPSWTKFNRIGPWLRHERDKRFYLGQLTNRGYVSGVRKWCVLTCFRQQVKVFSGMLGGFKPIVNQVAVVREELERIVHPRIFEQVKSLPERFIGVHIRKGDFARIGFSLPNDYYVRAIKIARERCGESVPILVFSDADAEELSYLKVFNDVRIMPSAPALQDLLSLAKSEILVATNRSTFSGWAAYLGGMPSLWAKDGEVPSVSIGLSRFELV